MTIEVPEDVVEAAIAASYPNGYEQITANMWAACQVVADWLDKTYRLSDTRHLIKADTEGWTVQHPQSCRPNLFTCPWSDPANTHYGRYRARGRGPGVFTGGVIPDPHGPDGVRHILCDRVDDDARP